MLVTILCPLQTHSRTVSSCTLCRILFMRCKNGPYCKHTQDQTVWSTGRKQTQAIPKSRVPVDEQAWNAGRSAQLHLTIRLSDCPFVEAKGQCLPSADFCSALGQSSVIVEPVQQPPWLMLSQVNLSASCYLASLYQHQHHHPLQLEPAQLLLHP